MILFRVRIFGNGDKIEVVSPDLESFKRIFAKVSPKNTYLCTGLKSVKNILVNQGYNTFEEFVNDKDIITSNDRDMLPSPYEIS